jgi:hypothetical protein
MIHGSSPNCSTNHSGLAEIFLRLRQTRRTLWPFCLCTLKTLFPGNGDRLDLRLVRGWEAAQLRHALGQICASPSRTARPRLIVARNGISVLPVLPLFSPQFLYARKTSGSFNTTYGAQSFGRGPFALFKYVASKAQRLCPGRDIQSANL